MWKKYRLQNPEGEVTGGGATAPAPAPAPASVSSDTTSAAPAASSAPASGDQPGTVVDDFDFGALVDHNDGKDVGEALQELSGAPAPAPAPPAPAAATPAPVPAPAPPAPASTEQQVAPPPAAPAPAPASSEQPPQPVDWNKHREEFLPKLEQMYALSDQEVQDLQTNPGAALPKLAAQLHYNVHLALQTAVQQMLPNMISGQIQQETLKTKYENDFYGKWPRLKEAVGKNREIESQIQNAVAVYRGQNPKATVQDTIDKVGLLMMITLGINPLEQQAPQGGAQAPAPVGAPIIPGRPAGVGLQGHVPAHVHGAAPGQQREEDLYGDIAQFHLNGGG
jgi:hypothetical protein